MDNPVYSVQVSCEGPILHVVISDREPSGQPEDRPADLLRHADSLADQVHDLAIRHAPRAVLFDVTRVTKRLAPADVLAHIQNRKTAHLPGAVVDLESRVAEAGMVEDLSFLYGSRLRHFSDVAAARAWLAEVIEAEDPDPPSPGDRL